MDAGTKVFMGSLDKKLREKFKGILKREGCSIIGEAEDGSTALRLLRSLEPDLVILDKELPGINGLDITQIVADDHLSPVILLLDQWDPEIALKLAPFPYVSLLVKPVVEDHLKATASQVINIFNKMDALSREIRDLKNVIAQRKKIEKAKGVLMELYHVSEEEAYRKMQKESMNHGKSMEKIADAILLMQDLGGQK